MSGRPERTSLRSRFMAVMFNRKIRGGGMKPCRFEDTCLICRRRILPEVLRHEKLTQSLNPGITEWKASIANSLCDMLGVDDKKKCGRFFRNAVYCMRCTSLICDAEFLQKSIKKLEARLDRIGERTRHLLLQNAEDILRRDFHDESNGVAAEYFRAIRKVTASVRGSSSKLLSYIAPEKLPKSMTLKEDRNTGDQFQLNYVTSKEEDFVSMDTELFESQISFLDDLTPTTSPSTNVANDRNSRLLRMSERKQSQVYFPNFDLKSSELNPAESNHPTNIPTRLDCLQRGLPVLEGGNVSVEKPLLFSIRDSPINCNPVKIETSQQASEDCVLTKKSLEIRIVRPRRVTQIYCNLCSSQFREESFFLRHLVKDHSVKVNKTQTLRCPVCPRRRPHWCMSRKELEEHMRLLHPDKPFGMKCSTCNLFSTTMEAHDHHETLHAANVANQTPYDCVVCDEDFCALILLHKHVKETHQTFILCPEAECEFKTHSQEMLRRHKFQHNIPDAKKSKCGYCEFKTWNLREFRRHLNKEHGVKHKCVHEGCSAEFDMPYSLRRHVRLFHEKKVKSLEKNYRCEICPREFKNLWALRAHVECHGDKRPYLCHLCPHAFKTGGVLKNHLKTHKLKPPGAHMNHSKPRRGRLPFTFQTQYRAPDSNAGADVGDYSNFKEPEHPSHYE